MRAPLEGPRPHLAFTGLVVPTKPPHRVDAAWKALENSVTRKENGRERCDGADEDGFLSNSLTINPIWIIRVAPASEN